MKTYIELHREKILKMKQEGASKEDIQKTQQEYDALIAKDMHDITCPYQFLYWN